MYVCERGGEVSEGWEGRMFHGETSFVDTWRAMEGLMGTGNVRAIGVSNFSSGRLRRCLRSALW